MVKLPSKNASSTRIPNYQGGLLTLSFLAKTLGISKLSAAMQKVKENFGQETVSIALDVTLKVGMRREKLQSIMLSDHYIN